jgi:hypothetical protein
MDNFHIDVVSEGKESFKHALEIAMAPHPQASHYAVIEHPVDANEWTKKKEKRKTLVLFWANDESFKPRPSAFPCKMKGTALVEFIWHWLEDAWENRAHGSEPDHDGDNGNAWRLFNEGWGHVAESPYAFVGIQPVWAMYGK